MIRIRLQRKGLKKKPMFLIVVADSKSPRDGKFIEKIGFYNPIFKKNIYINLFKLNYWFNKGAKLTNRVKFIKKIFIKNLKKNESNK